MALLLGLLVGCGGGGSSAAPSSPSVVGPGPTGDTAPSPFEIPESVFPALPASPWASVLSSCLVDPGVNGTVCGGPRGLLN